MRVGADIGFAKLEDEEVSGVGDGFAEWFDGWCKRHICEVGGVAQAVVGPQEGNWLSNRVLLGIELVAQPGGGYREWPLRCGKLGRSRQIILYVSANRGFGSAL
jgi:hypothetical protein